MNDYSSWIGATVALLTSLSYYPQVKKAKPAGATEDLSLRMLLALSTGLALWILYGVIKTDWVIVISNLVGGSLAATVLVFKIRDLRRN